jgi:hypothetical protein
VIRVASPLSTITVAPGPNSDAAALTASAVPRARGWIANVTRPSSDPSSRRSGPSTTTIFSAPASRAAATGQAIIGRPQSRCSSFGVAERMRVPSPAARITTTGLTTRESYPWADGDWGRAAIGVDATAAIRSAPRGALPV